MMATLEIPGTFNFRDFGGISIANGQKIKSHRLIRGGYLSDITEEGLIALRDYGVRTVIDLRSPYETEKYPDRLLPMMRYLHIPILDDDPTSSTMTDSEMKKLYAHDDQFGYERMLRSYRRMIIDPHVADAYRKFFQALESYLSDGTILVHCSGGKDRTGVCSYLLLALLGTGNKENLAFYLESNEASKSRINQRLKAANNAHLGKCFLQSVQDLVVVRPQYLEQATSLINLEFGGINNYLKEVVGIPAQSKVTLQQKLIS